MPYPSTHQLLAFGGPLFTLGEQWSCGIRSLRPVGAAESSADVLLSIAPTLSTWFGSTGGPIAGGAKLAWAKFNDIGPDGKYTSAQTNLWEYDPVVPGGASGAGIPPQVALVVTFETIVNRGLAAHGRIFLPQPRYAVAGDGRIDPTNALTVANSVRDLLDDLIALPGYGVPVVASKVREGAFRVIRNVTVGRTLDTMRSRRAQTPEEPGVPAPTAVPAFGGGGFGGDF